MTRREREFKKAFERDLPEYAKMCQGEEPVIIFHSDAFAADYQPNEFSLIGMAIKYAGLMGKEVRIIGRNRASLTAIQQRRLKLLLLFCELPTVPFWAAAIRCCGYAREPGSGSSTRDSIAAAYALSTSNGVSSVVVGAERRSQPGGLFKSVP